MASSPIRPWARLAYRVSQTARVGWFGAHYAAAKRLQRPLSPVDDTSFVAQTSPPSREVFSKSLRDLFKRDWQNVEQGIYAAPRDYVQNPLELLSKSLKFFRDVPRVDKRRGENIHSEVYSEELKDKYPRYYLQNFHYQTDGWLSEESADLYDYQVEVLFGGSADVMRRQALVPLYEALKGKDQRQQKLLDVATGTGRFLTFVKDNYPKLDVTALDLSTDYLAKAEKSLAKWAGVECIRANAENIPCDDETFDIVTCIYLFHELPPHIRTKVMGEIARVLKPGGTFIFVDSLQMGDVDGLDRYLEYFPIGFHEPYYASYAKQDLNDLFSEAGLSLVSDTPAFLSKVVVGHKDKMTF